MAHRLVVMGVAGCGRSSLGIALAGALACSALERSSRERPRAQVPGALGWPGAVA